MPSFRAHSVRFFKLEPKAITCIAHRYLDLKIIKYCFL